MGVDTTVRPTVPPPPDRTDTVSSSDGGTGKRYWRINWASVIVACIALTGLLVYMYPPTAAWWSQWNQSKVIRDYSAAAIAKANPENEVLLADAAEYNRLLSRGSILLGADANKPALEGGEETGGLNYWNLLQTPSEIMSRLKIPVINVDLPVYHGTSDEVLAKGVGHLQGTSLPVGGVDTHSVLSAHRGLASATMFNDLDKLKTGDIFVVETAGEVLTYQVFEKQVVEPSDTQTVLPRPGEDIMTLVTCTPLGINSHRILVTGERITPTPIKDLEAIGEPPNIPGFPWWAVILTGGTLVLGTYVWRSGYSVAPKSSSAA